MSVVGSIFRHLISFVSGWLVSAGILLPNEADTWASASVKILIGLVSMLAAVYMSRKNVKKLSE